MKITPQERADAFLKKYGELVKELEIDISHYPVFVPTDRGTFELRIQSSPVDVAKQPEPEEAKPVK